MGALIDISVDLTYAVDSRSDMILQIEAARDPDQKVTKRSLTFEGTRNLVHGPAEEGVGTRSRFVVQKIVSCAYHAEVELRRAAENLGTLQATPLTGLPDETLRYLMPSRYCAPGDFGASLDTLFGHVAGGALIATVSDWLHETFEYAPWLSNSDTTASDSFLRRGGVCRDYAQVLIAMARARGIPARFVACYAPDVRPQDFHAVAEVWLEGGWHLVDPTKMAEPAEIVRIGVGLDAAEVAFLTVFGQATMLSQTVNVARREV